MSSSGKASARHASLLDYIGMYLHIKIIRNDEYLIKIIREIAQEQRRFGSTSTVIPFVKTNF